MASGVSVIPASPKSIVLTRLSDDFLSSHNNNVIPESAIIFISEFHLEALPAGTYEYILRNGSKIILKISSEPFSGSLALVFTAVDPNGNLFYKNNPSYASYDIEGDGITLVAYYDNDGQFKFGTCREVDDIHYFSEESNRHGEFQESFLTGSGIGEPNAGGGISGEGGGNGDFDGSSDVIHVPGLPGISAVDTGFVTLYNPSLTQLKNLSSYMWSNDFFDQIIKLFGDPMDAILSLSIVPVAVPDGGAQDVKVGNVSTGVIMTKAAVQYISVDCGSLNMREFWGSALDYAPNTKIQLYLPYIGYKFIDTDEVMNKTLGITYHVDILTGSCVAFVHSNGSVLYQFEGNCACNLPVTGKSWANIVSAAINVAGTAAVLAGTGSITAATLATGLVNTVGNVMGAKAQIEHGGTSSGSGGQMSVQHPYLIVERPRQSLPLEYNSFEGYPSNITSRLGDLSGYTAVESVHLEGINATDSEISEIESLLKGGVIL